MSIKDWKKVASTTKQLNWKKVKDMYVNVIWNSYSNTWLVYTPILHDAEEFKTKKQALAYAKSYMIKH